MMGYNNCEIEIVLIIGFDNSDVCGVLIILFEFFFGGVGFFVVIQFFKFVKFIVL